MTDAEIDKLARPFCGMGGVEDYRRFARMVAEKESRDAQRYRWLRTTAVESSEYEDAKFIPCPVLVMTFIGVFDDDKKEFDAAIDAAMEANAKVSGAP